MTAKTATQPPDPVETTDTHARAHIAVLQNDVASIKSGMDRLFTMFEKTNRNLNEFSADMKSRQPLSLQSLGQAAVWLVMLVASFVGGITYIVNASTATRLNTLTLTHQIRMAEMDKRLTAQGIHLHYMMKANAPGRPAVRFETPGFVIPGPDIHVPSGDGLTARMNRH